MYDPSFNEAAAAAQQLLSEIFHFHDLGEFEAEAACFCEDGAWVRKDEKLKGRAAILAALRKRPATLITMHVVGNVVVHMAAPDEARVTFYLTTYAYDDGDVKTRPVGLRRLPSVGIGNASLRKTARGWGVLSLDTDFWKFQSRLSKEL